jgi:plasminogen activator inhibitor 1 RNA-binding protein
MDVPAFHDRNAGSYNNRNRPTDEQKEAGRRGIRARDDRGARTRQDRHPVRTGHTYVSLHDPRENDVLT